MLYLLRYRRHLPSYRTSQQVRMVCLKGRWFKSLSYESDFTIRSLSLNPNRFSDRLTPPSQLYGALDK